MRLDPRTAQTETSVGTVQKVLLSRNGIQDYRNKTRSEQATGRQREGRQVGEGQETGQQTGRQGLDNRRVVRQARGRLREGRQAGEEQETGKQTGPAGTLQQAGDQTGERSKAGRISVVE